MSPFRRVEQETIIGGLSVYDDHRLKIDEKMTGPIEGVDTEVQLIDDKRLDVGGRIMKESSIVFDKVRDGGLVTRREAIVYIPDKVLTLIDAWENQGNINRNALRRDALWKEIFVRAVENQKSPQKVRRGILHRVYLRGTPKTLYEF